MAGENRRPGLLRIVGADALPEARLDTAPTQLPSTGAAAVWDQARAGLSDIGATLSHTLDQVAASEGRRAGRLAGIDPEFRPTHSATISGRAFDEAGSQMAETAMKAAMANDMAAAHDKFRNDPTALSGELDRIQRAYVSKALPETLPGIQLEAQNARLGYMRDSSRIQIQATEHGQVAAFNEETAGAIKRMHQRAFQLGLDPQADSAMAGDLDGLRAALARKGVNGLPLATPEQQQKIVEHAKESVSNARALGAFDRLPSVGEKEAFIRKMEDDFGNGTGLAKVYTLDQFESLKRHLRSELHAAKAHDTVLSEGLKADIASIETMGRQGIVVAPEQIAGLRTRAIATGRGDMLASIEQAEKTAAVLRDARRYAPEDIESFAGERKARMNARAAAGAAVTGAPDLRSQGGPASVRFNNPGAMYPGPSSAKFGAVGTEIIGGGHKIAVFPDAVSGAAAQFDLLAQSYTGQTVRQAITRWSGGNDVSGYLATLGREAGIDPDAVLTRQMMSDPKIAVPLAKAMSVQEAGRPYPLSDEQWQAAHAMAQRGSREGMLAGKQDFAATRDEAKMVASLEGLAAHARSEIARDPLGWASQTGLVTVPPLDLSSPQSAALQSRVHAAEVTGRAYGREAVYLRPNERRDLAMRVQNGGREALAALGALATGFGDRMPKVAAELSKDGHAPVVASLAGLVAEVGPDSRAVRDALDGMALLRLKDKERLQPSPADAREVVKSELGSSLARMPADEFALTAVAGAIYETRAVRDGLSRTWGSAEKAAYRQALREAVGERTLDDGRVYGGVVVQSGWFSGSHHIVLPPKMLQKGWREAVQMITGDDLRAAGIGSPVGADGNPVSLDRVKGGTLLQYGSGRYLVATGDVSQPGREGIVYAGQPGELLVLDFAALAPILARRRPDLFHGVK